MPRRFFPLLLAAAGTLLISPVGRTWGEESPALPPRLPETDAKATPAENSSPTPEAPSDIRFTTWNLKNFLYTTTPPPEGSSEHSKPQKEQEAVIAILLKIRPDILGLCEMGSTADLANLQSRLKAGGLDLPHSEHVQGDDPSRHVALLSRFPILSRQPVTDQRYLLDNNEFPVQRGFLDVTVGISSAYQLRLVGAHLKSRRDTPEADQALMRRNEAHLLRQHLDSILTAAPTINLLIYGDFNDTRDQPGIKAVKGLRGGTAALTEIAAQDDSGERWTYYYPEADTYSRIDFLLASAALLPEVREAQSFLHSGKDWSKASDHRPVTTVIHPDDTPARQTRPRKKPKNPAPPDSPPTPDPDAPPVPDSESSN
ncbi:MAG: Endonuclease/Exonuclease/phosphatase family protein [Verrucomicrobiales bacterium]|nr:Endonuclease/Exonuclease/phosphatase family protein [Verrucomicrobiales bacterium]